MGTAYTLIELNYYTDNTIHHLLHSTRKFSDYKYVLLICTWDNDNLCETSMIPVSFLQKYHTLIFKNVDNKLIRVIYESDRECRVFSSDGTVKIGVFGLN